MGLKRKSQLLLPLTLALVAIGANGSKNIGRFTVDNLDEAINYSPTSNHSDLDFNFGWKFALGDSGTQDEADRDFDDESWKSVTLPHDWSIEQDFDTNIPPAMGMLPAGQGWYRKTFTIDEAAKGKKIYINFDGAYMDSTVYINGKKVGNYPYGYIPFSYDITPYIEFGAENLIAVSINSPLGGGRNSSRWYAGAGINRDVTLTFDSPTHLERHGVYFTDKLNTNIETGGSTSSIQKGDDALSIATQTPKTKDVATHAQIEATNSSDKAIEVKAVVRMYEYESGALVKNTDSFESKSISVAANSTETIGIDFVVPEIQLWDIDDPHLYSFVTQLIDNATGEVLDTTTTRYGYKRSVFTLNDGYYLNGRLIKLHGVCLHPDQGSLGDVTDFAAVNRQIRIMKEMGVNTIRTAHCPFSETFMRACDENGILVMEEWYDTWFQQKNTDDYHKWFNVQVPTDENHPLVETGDTWHIYDLRMTLRRDRNDPSVLMYSIGNEIAETTDNRAPTLASGMVDEIRKNDNNTPVTMGFPMWSGSGTSTRTQGTNSWKTAEELDIVGFNYPSQGKEDYDTSHENFKWIVFNSESASAWKSRGYFSNKQGWNMQGVTNQESSLDTRTHFYSMTSEWKTERNRKHVLGEYIWTGFDYLGEPQPYDGGSNPSKSSYYGSVDTAGFPKAEFYMLKSQWSKMEQDPFVKVVNHVNLDDDNLRNQITTNNDGKTVELWVSSNASSVRLTLVNNDGTETEIDFKDWDQSINPANDSNRLQEPKDNPSAYANKLYQVFRIDWSQLKGHDVRAYAYDKPKAEVTLTGAAATRPIAVDAVDYSQGSQAIKLTPERRDIASDGHDLCYIAVDITDLEGNINYNAMDKVTFSIKGDGEIVGVDNGDPYTKERYKYATGQTWSRSAFNGKALVIVRSTQKSGSFTLTAQGSGLIPAETTVFTSSESASGDIKYASDIASTVVKVGSTLDDLRRVLPSTVNVFSSTGETGLVGNVVWDTSKIKPSAFSANNTFYLFGTIAEYPDVQAKVMVNVIGGISYSAPAIGLITTPNKAPTFPTSVAITSSDGSIISAPVTWFGNYDDPTNYPEAYSYRTVFGEAEVNSTKVEVAATVNVVPEDSIKAGQVQVNSVSATYQEGVHKTEELTDGKIGGTNGWGNWYSHNYIRPEDSITLNFARTNVSSIDIYYLTQATDQLAYALPDTVEIFYLNDLNQYVSVTHLKQPEMKDLKSITEGTTPDDPTSYGNAYTFDTVNTSSLKVTFKITTERDHDAGNKASGAQAGTSYTMLKVSEIEVNGEVISNLSPDAMIGNVWFNGVLFKDFDYTRFDYNIAVNNLDQAPFIQANGIFGSTIEIVQSTSSMGIAKILVTSADGSQTLVYTFNFYIAE